MAGKIKGITLEIGGDATELNKALGEVNKKTKDLQTELKSVDRLLKLDPGNVELVAQKQKILAEAVDNSKEKLDRLRRAQDQVNAAFERGDIDGEQYRHFSRQVVNAEQDLNKFERELKQVGNAADKTKRDLGELGRKVEDVGGKLSMGITLPVVGGAFALTEGTREDRQDLGKLEAAFTTSGFTAEQATQTYVEFYKILGETDTAIEAANLLAELVKSQEDLDKWVTIGTGVYAKFGDSLPIEGMIEAANETAKVGKVTGPLADALNWVGISEDKFNESLAACTTEQERQALITETLTGAYSGVAQKYREVNKNVIEANEAHAELGNSLADLANKLEPIVTKAVKALSRLLDMFNNMPEGGKNMILVVAGIAAAVGPLLLMVAKALFIFQMFGDKLGWVTKIVAPLINIVSKIGPLLSGLASGPVGWAILAITGLIAIFTILYKTSDTFRAWVDGLVRMIKEGFGNMVSEAKQKINALADLLNKLPGVDIGYVYDAATMGIAGESKRSHFASGTNYAPGGLAWVGERGPELLDLPRGTKVYNNRESMAMVGRGQGGGSQTVNHTGEITVRGVNSMDQLVGVTKIIAKEFERGNRRIPARVATMPSMA